MRLGQISLMTTQVCIRGACRLHKQKGAGVRIGFASIGTFAALDVVMLLGSGEYRDALGVTHGVLDPINLGRIVLDVSMIAFYRWVYVKMREGRVLLRLMVWHGLLFGLLGLGLCIPLVGIF